MNEPKATLLTIAAQTANLPPDEVLKDIEHPDWEIEVACTIGVTTCPKKCG